MSVQAPRAVLLIRPHRFTANPHTAEDNSFQSLDDRAPDVVAQAAYDEVTAVEAALIGAGVTVHLFEDTSAESPDSVFPNNWISTHAGGHVALYPMFVPNRRTERRPDIVEMLKSRYRVQDVIDYSGLEHDDVFLEGTGAMVLDHELRIAYTARSHRADPVILERFCTNFGFEPIVFDALDPSGMPVYHTNVMMCIATDFVLAGLDLITSGARRAEVARRLTSEGRVIVDLDVDQISSFAGNAIELQGDRGRVLAISSRAWRSLRAEQRAIIELSASPLVLDVPTIERAGGSVRCMLAGIHLETRPADQAHSEPTSELAAAQ
ncbi:MAG: amidinotransferase [Salinibacterium sp.]|nr:amidinotransferase [Salinibacterium sp.]